MLEQRLWQASHHGIGVFSALVLQSASTNERVSMHAKHEQNRKWGKYSEGDGGRYKVRTCDFHRVKVALYH